jgi:hypothetical protein
MASNRRPGSKALFATLLLLAFAAASWSASAQQAMEQAQMSSDSQGGASTPVAAPKTIVRTVRLSFFSGDLKVQRLDNTGENAAVLNMPLNAGTRLVTGENSTAEIEFEDGSVVRLTPQTALSLDALGLDDRSVAHTELSLLNGVAYFELRHSPSGTYLVDAAGVDAAPTENAVFRVTLNEPPAVFAVFSGSIQTETTDDGFSAVVNAGESLRADAEDSTSYLLNHQVAEDGFDAWNQGRDQLAAEAANSRTAARDAFAGSQGDGWSDLDANGTWYSVPNADGSEGEAWQPAVAANDDSGDEGDGFDPYGDGAFVWSSQGYLWASGYSWGWLPYRCGRWNWYVGLGWVWRPNRFCGSWGFQSGGVFLGRRPPHYRVAQFPVPKPGSPVHPILRVHHEPAPHNPPRPAGTEVAAVKMGNATAIPMALVAGPTALNGYVLGAALYRDYPVQTTSRQPLLGTIARSIDQPERMAGEPSGWVAHQNSGASSAGGVTHVYRSPERTTTRVPGNSPPSRPAPAPAAPAAPRSAPASTPSSTGVKPK